MKTKIFLFILIFIALPLSVQCKTVLIIESYHAEYEWDISYKKPIYDILAPDNKIIEFQMDTKRLPKNQHSQMADKAWHKFNEVKPDLVILGDDAALKYLGPKLSKTDTPVIFLGINNNPREYDIIGKKNITGVLERPLMKRSISFISRIVKPVPEKILILFDSGITSKASVENELKQIHMEDTATDIKLISSFKDWKQTVLDSEKNGYDVIIVGLYQTLTDENGKNVNGKDVLNWTSENTPVPPFAFWDFSAGKNKTIGGYVLFGESQGKAAAEMAVKILKGTPPVQIRIEIPEKGHFLFSKSQLKKWEITLPDEIMSRASFVE
ncbi:MAG: sugar ABC transporter [Desulfobacteraceae bacterium]|nr:sugar ABC transporter [Desulfobacteraceae bacterium]